MSRQHSLRPALPADIPHLQDLFAQSIEELTQDDYDEQQRLAWISRAADQQAFARRLLANVTLVVEHEGELAGFATLKDNSHIEMLFVHPYAAGEGVGSTLIDALEKIAAGRGAEKITVDASESAVEFFESRGYTALRRNSVAIDNQWLSNTTMSKPLKSKPALTEKPK